MSIKNTDKSFQTEESEKTWHWAAMFTSGMDIFLIKKELLEKFVQLESSVRLEGIILIPWFLIVIYLVFEQNKFELSPPTYREIFLLIYNLNKADKNETHHNCMKYT